MNPDFYMLCEIPAILYVYKVESNFSDAALYYFPILKIFPPSVCLLSVSLTESKKERTLE